MADTTSLDASAGATYIVYIIFIGFIIFQRLGGWPEAMYRIRRIPYFVDYIRGPDKRFRRRIFPLDMIQKHSPAMFRYGRGDYMVPDEAASASANGAPMWLHNWDDSRPIETNIDTIHNPDGSVTTKFRERIPPEVIQAGFEGKVVADLAHEGDEVKSNKLAWYIVPMLLILLLAIVVELYYGYNNYCGLHPKSC